MCDYVTTDRANPPSQLQLEEIPRATESLSSFFILVSWTAPIYRGRLEQLSYRLQEMRTKREWIVHSTSIEVMTTYFANVVFSVEVVDETNSSVSEKGPELRHNLLTGACSKGMLIFCFTCI